MSRRLAFPALVAFTCLAAPVSAQVGTWSIHPTRLPSPNSEFSAVVVDGRVYTVGGYQPAASFLLQIYDPATDTWQLGPPVPEGTHHGGVAAVDGRIYVIAGGPSASTRVQIYDVAAGAWTQGAPMPSARTALAVAVVDGKIHAIGGSIGINHGLAVTTHEVYDPATNSWTARAPLPIGVEHTFAAVVGGRIHVAAGRDHLVSTNLLQIYDPATDTWSVGPPLIADTSGHAVEVCD